MHNNVAQQCGTTMWHNNVAQQWSARLFNPVNAESNPICHLLTLLGAHHILHVSRIRVKDMRTYIKWSGSLAE
jgi:hypothetical protein